MHYRVVRVDDELVDRQPPVAAAYKNMPGHYLTYDEAEEAADNLRAPEKGRFRYIISGRYDPRDLERNSSLTVPDVDNIVRRNFAPNVEKLVSEIVMNLGNHAALYAIGARIVADHGQDEFRKVMERIDAINTKEFSNPEGVDLIVSLGRPRFRGMRTKMVIVARRRLDGLYWGACGKRKKTTKAEAVARHIDALVKLLRNEPDTIVGPILDSLLERTRSGSG